VLWSFQCQDARRAEHVRGHFLAFLHTFAADSSDFAAAELIFGELVGNVVRHAPGRINIRLDWTGSDAILWVADTGEGFESRSRLPDAFSESGRGLFIVSTLAREFHIDKIEGDGTQACAVLPVSTKKRENSVAC